MAATGGICELALEVRDLERLEELGIAHRGPIVHAGGDRSLDFSDPEGNVVQLWDHFARM